MEPIYIILEGPDRCGKDTQQNLIVKNISHRVFHKLHYSALPFQDKEKHIMYSTKLYDEMFKNMSALSTYNINAIFNRSYLSESVYAPLYRNYNGDYVFDIEKKHRNLLDKIYLITMINQPETLNNRDDGNSQSNNIEDITAEIDGFVRSHHKSLIKNKLLLDTKNMKADEVSNIISQFLSEKRPNYIDQQLSLTF